VTELALVSGATLVLAILLPWIGHRLDSRR
jgi:hypothetical protein